MAINQLTSSNTFDHWLTTTQELIGVTNAITDGPGITANTALDIDGLNAQLNVRTQASIDTFYANVANIANISFSESNLTIPGNIVSLNVSTDGIIGSNLIVHGNTTISGNIAITHNLTVNQIDSLGIITASQGITTTSNGSFGNVIVNETITVGEIEFQNANGISISVSGNAAINGTANIGRVEGGIVSQFQDSIIAFSIALG